MKRAGRVTIFIIILCFFIHITGEIFTPKWEADGLWEPSTLIVDGFYEEDKNTIDVLYLGSSNSFYDINPLVIYENENITGYVLGSGEQRIYTSYFYLQEALKYQQPKVVVLDALGLFYSGRGEEEQNRKAYDYMKLSKEKIESLQIAMGEEESMLSYIFPIARYHARYSSLTERDFVYPFSDKHYALKGYAFSETVAEGLPDFSMSSIVHEGITLPKENRYYFQRINELCQKNGITLLLIKTPNIEWGSLEHALTEELAKEYSVVFYDYNTFMGEIGIEERDCFLDGAHLNYKGAELLSTHLGSIVAGYLSEEAEKAQSVDADWKKDVEIYKKLLAKVQ